MAIRRLFTFFITVWVLTALLGYSGSVTASPAGLPASQGVRLPRITFLGDGPGTFTIEAPNIFLVKTYQNDEFVFVTLDGPTYTAVNRERVWSTDYVPAENFRFFHDGRSYGTVEAGCVVNYVQIEDNVDDRRNFFFLDGELLHTLEQGMVSYGTFTVPSTGELTFFANDSVGLVVDLCQSQVVNTPAGFTPTSPSPATPVSPTFTATAPVPPPGVEETPTAPTPTSTDQVSENVETPVQPPPEIPLSGGGPGPREVGWTGAALMAALALVAGAWWRLLRWNRNGK